MKKGKTSRIIFGSALSLIFLVIVGSIVLDDAPTQPSSQDNQVTAEFKAIVNEIALQSVIDKDTFTESDNDWITNILDANGLNGSTPILKQIFFNNGFYQFIEWQEN